MSKIGVYEKYKKLYFQKLGFIIKNIVPLHPEFNS